MKFIVVTGMSGAGKRAALKILEDVGYYCVDNLPIPLVGQFVELMLAREMEYRKVALVLDVRADEMFLEAGKMLGQLRNDGILYELLFIDASDEVLVKRYKESRRIHPLSNGGNVVDGIKRERKALMQLKMKSDFVIDTSHLLIRELQSELIRIFIQKEEYKSLMIHVVSFGFKKGIPTDADLVFDVRFLPNPYYDEALRTMSGNDKEVQDYVMKYEEANVFIEKLTEMIEFLIPNYVKEGKHQLFIAIGCTGGQHRSVTLANELYKRLNKKSNYGITIRHRDVI